MYLSVCIPIRDLPECVTHVTFQIIQYNFLSVYFWVQFYCANPQESENPRVVCGVKIQCLVYSRVSLPRPGEQASSIQCADRSSAFDFSAISRACEYLQTFILTIRNRDVGLKLS